MTALEMILDAVTVVHDDYGQTYTVDGESGSFSGILTTPASGNLLTLGGLQPNETAQLVVPKPADWTPADGARITARDVTYKVTQIDDEQTHYRLTLEGVDQ